MEEQQFHDLILVQSRLCLFLMQNAHHALSPFLSLYFFLQLRFLNREIVTTIPTIGEFEKDFRRRETEREREFFAAVFLSCFHFFSSPLSNALTLSLTSSPPLFNPGFNVETVEYKNISFTVWDVGGQDKVRRGF